MGTAKQYDEEFKKQAIKLAKEVCTIWNCTLYYLTPVLLSGQFISKLLKSL